jgi:uracil-DNA glycosylase family 4
MLNFNEKTLYDGSTFTDLKTQALSCTKCHLCVTRTKVVFGHGPSPCDVMIIGEAPGEKEDLEGKPFIGKSGQLLTKLLESVNINRDEQVYITNTVKCRPPKNRAPKQTEIDACKPYLIKQIQSVKPKLLLLLGNPSLKTILNSQLTITKVRGNWYTATVDYMNTPLYIIPLFHPSYLLRNPSKDLGKPICLTIEDLKEVSRHLSLSLSPSHSAR